MKEIILSLIFLLGVFNSYGFCDEIYANSNGKNKADQFLKEYASDPDCPIKYNDDRKVYYIEYETVENGVKSRILIPIHYCPITGKRVSFPRK